MHSNRSLFEELAQFSGSGVETRAENAFSVAVKFMELLKREVDDERAFDLMMKAWLRAVRDEDFSKFRRTYMKYRDQSSQK